MPAVGKPLPSLVSDGLPRPSSPPGHGEQPAEAALWLSEAKKGGTQGPFSLLSDSGDPTSVS